MQEEKEGAASDPPVKVTGQVAAENAVFSREGGDHPWPATPGRSAWNTTIPAGGHLLPVGLTDSLQWGQSVSQAEVAGLVVTLPQEAIKAQYWINEEKMASEVYGCLRKPAGKRVLLKRRVRHHEGIVRTRNSSSSMEITLEDVTFGKTTFLI